MNRTEALTKTNKIVSSYLKIPVEKLFDDVSYEEESVWDSVTHLKIISDIEKMLEIKIEIEEMIDLETVGKIREIVVKKLEGK